MFKRLVWMGLGATAGAGASLWVTWRVRRAVASVAPDRLGHEVSERIRGARRQVVDAVAEGRQAMAAREAELRAQLATAGTPGTPGTSRRPAPGTAPPARISTFGTRSAQQ